MDEVDWSCFSCKHAIDEGDILCIRGMIPGNYMIVDWDANLGCEHYEEAEASR